MQIRANVLPPAVNRTPAVKQTTAEPSGLESPAIQNKVLNYALWQLDRIAWLLGLSTHWRMFSPPPKTHWYYSVWAVLDSGELKWIPLASQGQRNWPQRQFVDFREVKFHLNLYNRKEPLYAFAQHLCRKEREKHKTIQAVRIALVSRRILSPAEAFKQGSYYGPETTSDFGTYLCSEKAIS